MDTSYFNLIVITGLTDEQEEEEEEDTDADIERNSHVVATRYRYKFPLSRPVAVTYECLNKHFRLA